MATSSRNDPVRLFWRRVLTAGILVMAVFAGVGVVKVYLKERESAALRAQAEAGLADLESRHEKLETDVAALRTESGKEKVLRGAYDVGKRGEHLIVIVEPTAPSHPRATTTPWYERLKWW